MRQGLKSKTSTIIISVAVALVIAASAFTAGFFTRKCTQRRELSSYEWALNIINRNYYFGGVNATFTDSSLSAIANECLDRYSEYYTAEEYKEVLKSNSGAKSGIGVSYSYVKGRGIYVSSVTGNSPAAEAGLRAGEFIESGNDGKSTVSFTDAEDFKDFIGSAGDGESLTLHAADGATYAVAKSQYAASYAYLCTNASAWIFDDAAEGGFYLKETAETGADCLPDGAAYIKLSQFYGDAAEEFYSLVEKFNAMRCTSLILDLRTNGGGYVDVMCDIAGAFADGDKKIAMVARDKSGRESKEYCAKVTDARRRISKDTKVYVMANSGTASASEALMGAMLCYGALKNENIFLSDYSQEYLNWLKDTGQEQKTARTFGKGIMQSTFVNRSTGEALKLTTAKIYWPDGETCIHDTGITKGTPVSVSWQHTKTDEELKAVAYAIRAK